MNDDDDTLPEKSAAGQPPSGGTYQQELQHSVASARVPEHVGRGVFSTGVIVMNGAHEFVLDFVLRMTPPHRIAARVVLPPTVVALFIRALRENIDKFQQKFGTLPRMPAPPPGVVPPPISEVYEQLKLPDEQLSGVYANAVMIVHTPGEFCFDFVTSFYPRSSVSSRVYLSALHVPQLLDSLVRSYEQYAQRMQQNRPPEPPTVGIISA